MPGYRVEVSKGAYISISAQTCRAWSITGESPLALPPPPPPSPSPPRRGGPRARDVHRTPYILLSGPGAEQQRASRENHNNARIVIPVQRRARSNISFHRASRYDAFDERGDLLQSPIRYM